MSDPKDQEKEKPSADIPPKPTPEERDAALANLYSKHTIERLSDEFKDKILENYDSDNPDDEFIENFFSECEEAIVTCDYSGPPEACKELEAFLNEKNIPDRLREPDPESDDYDPDVPYIDESYFEDEDYELISTLLVDSEYSVESSDELDHVVCTVANFSCLFPDLTFDITVDGYDMGFVSQTYRNGEVVSQSYEGPEPDEYEDEDDEWWDDEESEDDEDYDEEDEDYDEDGDDEDYEEEYDQEEDDGESEDSAEDEEGGEKKEG